MKEIRNIVQAFEEIDFSVNRAALATVVRIEGSSYRRTGARMLVVDDGRFVGGISGGCLEGDALRRARLAILASEPSLVTYDTTQEDGRQLGAGLGCQGIIDVLFTPIDPDSPYQPIALLSSLTHTREPRILITVINGGEEAPRGKNFLETGPGTFTPALPPALATMAFSEDIGRVWELGRSRSVRYRLQGREYQLFLELILPPVQLILLGSNYDIAALVSLAQVLGWDTTVMGQRSRIDKAVFRQARQVLQTGADPLPAVDAYTAIVLMSHDFKTDKMHLPWALASPAPYVGMLGPAKRANKMLTELGLDSAPEKLFAPAGLDIGAESPEEIALSIVSEIQVRFRRGQAHSLKHKQGAIHEP